MPQMGKVATSSQKVATSDRKVATSNQKVATSDQKVATTKRHYSKEELRKKFLIIVLNGAHWMIYPLLLNEIGIILETKSCLE